MKVQTFTTNLTRKERIEWVDIAKGMSIILVVLGHTRFSEIPFIGNWFGAFRMPFFFFVSGLLFNPLKNSHFRPFLSKKSKTLLRPFYIFSVIVLLGYASIGFGLKDQVEKVLRYGWLGYALWFIPILLLTNLLYFGVCKIFKTNANRLIGIIILGTLGCLSDKLNMPNYWNICFSLTAVFFYGLGNLLAPYLISTFKSSIKRVWILALVCLLISLGFLLNDKPEFFVNELGKPGLTHIVAIAGTIMMCCFAFCLARIDNIILTQTKRFLIYYGKNSYVVLAFHQILILSLVYFLPSLPKVLTYIIMWTLVTVLIEVINRKVPFILGR